MDDLLNPTRLWNRQEMLTTDVVPRSPGVYAWWFRQVPPAVPAEGCVVRNDLTLLYVGLSLKSPPQDGVVRSTQTLRSRLRCHMNGTAEGSTLRLMGSGRRMTFGRDGEATLSDWIAANAFVCWLIHDRPWEAEAKVIRSVCLPLNLAQNAHHGFHAAVSACRAAAKKRGRRLPIFR